jgi:diguanylate cyclase (GGDEF)-like protein
MISYMSLAAFLWFINHYHSKQEKREDQEVGSERIALTSKKRKTKIFYFILSAVSLVIVGVIDLKTGYRISSMPFYLIPILLATLFVGRFLGVAIAIICSIVWLWADLKVGGSRYVYFFTPYWNALARMFFFLLAILAIELRNAFMKEKKQARVDYLTGAANRKYFYELTTKEIDRCKRYKHSFSLAFLDFDNFKQVNDHYGHRAGDKLLREVADTIKSNVRGSDTVARFGGDEFVVLLTETGLEGALNYIKRINVRVSEALQKRTWPVTISFGIVTCNTPSLSLDEIINKADELMYSAKKSGKNRIEHMVIEK